MPIPYTHKPPRPYADPVSNSKTRPRFISLPARAKSNLVLPLNAVDTGAAERVSADQELVFHTVGDTGDVGGGDMQHLIALAMESQFTLGADSRPVAGQGNPAFFYHLGDVVYYNGLYRDYPQQFYEQYKGYPAVIFAIPGNHDGDTRTRAGDQADNEPSLYGFMQNFCDSSARQGSDYRDTMTQPFVYWTLTTPLATIIGLYGNVDGLLDGLGTVEQQAWLQQQLSDADPTKCLILAVHQPPYSLDSEHGGYPYIGDAIDRACQGAGRWPDLVLSGHVHNYQRFTRTNDGPGAAKQIPYVIAGAGGYADNPRKLHKLTRGPRGALVPVPLAMPTYNLSLNSYNEVEPGFLRIRIKDKTISGEYYTVPFAGPPRPTLFDQFSVDCAAGTVTEGAAGSKCAHDPLAF